MLEKQGEDLVELEKLLLTEKDDALQRDVKCMKKKLLEELADVERLAFFSGPHDKKPAILSITAGAGGTDAQDWAEMLFRMYLRYGEKQGWKSLILDENKGSEVGYKTVTIRMEGEYTYGHLRHEVGVHRLIRLSPFNADNLRQTSFASVSVLPEIEKELVTIAPDEVEFSAFRAGGKGGQNVNKVSTAVRLRHIPTDVTVSVSSERSQAQNREQALRLLVSKLEYLREQQHVKTIHDIRGGVMPVDFGSQTRSYILHPYTKVIDHKTGVETSDVQEVLDGDISAFIEGALRSEDS